MSFSYSLEGARAQFSGVGSEGFARIQQAMVSIRGKLAATAPGCDPNYLVECAKSGMQGITTVLGLPPITFTVDPESKGPIFFAFEGDGQGFHVTFLTSMLGRVDPFHERLREVLRAAWMMPFYFLVDHHSGPIDSYVLRDIFSKPPVLDGFMAETASICRVEWVWARPAPS